MVGNDKNNLQATLNKISTKPNVHLKLLSIFLSQFETDVVELEKSVTDKDHNNVFQTAHKLKSALKIFDHEMYDQVSRLEKYGSDKVDFEKISSEYSNFSTKVRVKIPLLQEAKASLESQLNS